MQLNFNEETALPSLKTYKEKFKQHRLFYLTIDKTDWLTPIVF